MRTVVGLVVAIAAADVVANVLVPEGAKVPLKLAIASGFVAWARWSAGCHGRSSGSGGRTCAPVSGSAAWRCSRSAS